MTEEPTVLDFVKDYIKSKLKFWEASTVVTHPQSPAGTVPQDIGLAAPGEQAVPLEVMAVPQPPSQPRPAFPFPWRTLIAFGLGLLAQISLEPHKDWRMGAFLYGLAFLWLVVANWRGEWRPVLAPEHEDHPNPVTIRPLFLLAGLAFTILAYGTFGGGRFNPTNVILWILALVSYVAAFWITTPGGFRRGWARLWGWVKRPQVTLTSWALLLILVALISLYFRAYLLNEIPSQMNSDHAEKLLDVWDVEHGITRIFFPRNTGREAFQFYLIAATDKIFHTGLSFLTMKLGAITAGLLTLPFIYLIGLEIGNRWVGLWAMAFAGIAYWPNAISRLALRHTFYAFFVAPTLYFLIRGLRRKNQNDLLLAGLVLGLGLHSYSPIRILPIVVVVGVMLYMLHHLPLRAETRAVSMQTQKQVMTGLAVLTLVAVIGFLPLLSYITSNKLNREAFFVRGLTRFTSLERKLPGNPLEIFLSNTWNAMRMFGWDNGDVWTFSVPHHPALDTISAALCYLGMGLLLIRYVRKRNWLDLFLLLSVPMLMLPSILSLAFPNENPLLNRTSGAIVPVFVMVGIALESLLSTLWERLVRTGVPRVYGAVAVAGLGIGLFLLSANDNYDLVFNQYRISYELQSWNSTEMGLVYRDFATTIGSPNTFWQVGYPYWVDSRLICIVAGYTDRNCVVMPDELSTTLAETRAKLFILNIKDADSLAMLQQLYPLGTAQEYQSKYPKKNFLMFFVPPSQ
jgi:hypothetical protein